MAKVNLGAVSAYAIAVKNGFTGTEQEWLKTLKADAPQKGTDYWTPEDIAQIKSYVDDAILNGRW